MITFIIILIISLCLYKFFNSKNSDNFSNIDEYTYTIGIPCILRDVPKLENLINNINEQTKKPLEVLISLSGADTEYGKELEQKLNKISNNVKIVTSKEMKYAGENRNIVLDNANGDVIAFIDADDTMHPQRIEIVDKIFKEEAKKGNYPIGILHGYIKRDENLISNYNINIEKSELWDGKKLYKYHKIEKPERKYLLNKVYSHTLAHGHPIIKKNVNIKYTDISWGEDVIFVRDILDYYGNNNNNLYYTNLKLTTYKPRNRQEVKEIKKETKKDRIE